MIISKKHQFIFFSSGKTGTTSIESVLKKYEDYKLPHTREDAKLFDKHIPPFYVKNRIDKQLWDDSYKFCFVRNPWDWTISRWKYNLKKWNIPDSDKITLEIIERIRKINSPHFRGIFWADSVYQASRIEDPSGNLLPDFIGKYENLQVDFDNICHHIGIAKEKLPHLKTSDRGNYRDYYCDKTQKKIASLYRKDIKIFDYEYSSIK